MSSKKDKFQTSICSFFSTSNQTKIPNEKKSNQSPPKKRLYKEIMDYSEESRKLEKHLAPKKKFRPPMSKRAKEDVKLVKIMDLSPKTKNPWENKASNLYNKLITELVSENTINNNTSNDDNKENSILALFTNNFDKSTIDLIKFLKNVIINIFTHIDANILDYFQNQITIILLVALWLGAISKTRGNFKGED